MGERNRFRYLAVVVLAAACASIFTLWPRQRPAPQPTAVPVNVSRVSIADFPVYVSAVGSVMPINVTDVRVRVDGQLQKLLFAEGQEVSSGQVLAQLDSRPFLAQLAQAEATLRKDAASLANAKLDFDRYTKLAPIGATTAQNADTAKARVAELRATVASDQAVVRNDRLLLEFTTLVAPFDGRVGAREAGVGAIVHTTDAKGIFVVTQMAPITVAFSVPQDLLQQFLHQKSSGALSVTVFEHDGGAQLAEGTLTFIDSHVDPSTGQVAMKAWFRNVDRKLWPGLLVGVRVLLRTDAGQLAVPSKAVMHTQEGTQVYVLASDDTTHLRLVETDISVDGTTEIKTGLKDGEIVVLDGQSRLNPGSRVTSHFIDPKSAAASATDTPPDAAS
jgi:multidrug efflux system membrane fusion protein